MTTDYQAGSLKLGIPSNKNVVWECCMQSYWKEQSHTTNEYRCSTTSYSSTQTIHSATVTMAGKEKKLPSTAPWSLDYSKLWRTRSSEVISSDLIHIAIKAHNSTSFKQEPPVAKHLAVIAVPNDPSSSFRFCFPVLSKLPLPPNFPVCNNLQYMSLLTGRYSSKGCASMACY